MVGGEGAYRLVDDDEALYRELQSVVGLEPLEIAPLQALPRAELADVVRKRLEASVAENRMDRS